MSDDICKDGGKVELIQADKPQRVGVGPGDFQVTPGRGGAPDGKDGSIIFSLANGTEVIRFDPDGKCFVRGEQVDDNVMIYREVVRWFAAAGLP